MVCSFCLTGCTGNADNQAGEKPNNQINPENVDFTGNGKTGVDSALDNTLGVDVNSDQTNNVLEERNHRLKRTNHQNVNNNSNTDLTVSDKASERVKALPEVSAANVLITDNNAYVAVKLKRPEERMTNRLQTKITRALKENRTIEGVYISENPIFYQRMERYTGDIRAGRPVGGFVDEFSDTIRRLFPDAS
jgi:spore cortex protein